MEQQLQLYAIQLMAMQATKVDLLNQEVKYPVCCFVLICSRTRNMIRRKEQKLCLCFNNIKTTHPASRSSSDGVDNLAVFHFCKYRYTYEREIKKEKHYNTNKMKRKLAYHSQIKNKNKNSNSCLK